MPVNDRETLAPPFFEMPEGSMIPMQSVPTDIEIGPDGNYYVSELTGFPFPAGEARVYQVSQDGDVEVFSEGFSMIGAIDFDSDGRLHVLEIVDGGFLALDFEAIEEGDFSSAVSRVVRVEADGTQTDLGIPGVYFGTGLAVGAGNELYVAHLSVTPFAELIRIGTPADDPDPAPDVQTFSTQMTGDEEVPAVETTAGGSATFEVSEDGTSVSFEVTLDNLEDTTMAHIHLAPAGVNGPVVVWLYPDTPPAELIPGPFSGVLSSGSFTAEDLVGPLEGEDLSALLVSMIAGETYVNIHTEANPGGEIRGQIALDLNN